mmetsp:Transcript_29413/g.78641  ORF Transcript_29413/g.78641 Transcript_29413/m.78641 type:complete len:261 (-) Transcript_29413:471-1253(-)
MARRRRASKWSGHTCWATVGCSTWCCRARRGRRGSHPGGRPSPPRWASRASTGTRCPCRPAPAAGAPPRAPRPSGPSCGRPWATCGSGAWRRRAPSPAAGHGTPRSRAARAGAAASWPSPTGWPGAYRQTRTPSSSRWRPGVGACTPATPGWMPCTGARARTRPTWACRRWICSSAAGERPGAGAARTSPWATGPAARSPTICPTRPRSPSATLPGSTTTCSWGAPAMPRQALVCWRRSSSTAPAAWTRSRSSRTPPSTA